MIVCEVGPSPAAVRREVHRTTKTTLFTKGMVRLIALHKIFPILFFQFVVLYNLDTNRQRAEFVKQNHSFDRPLKVSDLLSTRYSAVCFVLGMGGMGTNLLCGCKRRDNCVKVDAYYLCALGSPSKPRFALGCRPRKSPQAPRSELGDCKLPVGYFPRKIISDRSGWVPP